MKEIYLMNKGDSIAKVKAQLKLNGEYVLSENKLFDNSYIELNKSSNDIILVKNYLTKHLYTVKNGETIFDIISRGFVVEEGVEGIKEGDVLIISKPRSVRHIVKPLETLENISRSFGVDKSVIMEVNNLQTEKLFIGQILWI